MSSTADREKLKGYKQALEKSSIPFASDLIVESNTQFRSYKFQLLEVERPVPGLDEVLIKIEVCGICGTDFHAAGKLACDWMPIGHEFVGSIAELGSNVQGYRIGEEVVAQNAPTRDLRGLHERTSRALPEYFHYE